LDVTPTASQQTNLGKLAEICSNFFGFMAYTVRPAAGPKKFSKDNVL
jgi:hypothetical protein